MAKQGRMVSGSHAALLFVAGFAFCATVVAVAAHAQERNRLDRPKDSQDVCGYTLRPGQVERINDSTAKITVNVVIEAGSGLDYVNSILAGPVCAFAVDNPEVTDVGIAVFDTRSPSRFAPVRVKPEIGAVIVTFRKRSVVSSAE